MKVREPIVRPLDVVAAELLVTISQAFVAGALAYLAAGFWSERGVGSGPVVAILAAAAVAVSAAWLFWLLGGAGWPMALIDAPVALYMGFALLLGLQGNVFLQMDLLVGLLTLAGAAYGVGAGFFLDSPRRWRWDQRRTPRPGRPVPRVSPATERLVGRLKRPGTAARRGQDGPAPAREQPPVAAPTETGTQAPPVVRMATPRESAPHSDPPRRPHVAAPDGTHRASQDVPPAQEGRGPAVPPGVVRSRSAGPPVRPGIDLPTSDEPKARRSPWPWASPPEWNRDDLEEEAPPEGDRTPR